MGMETPFGGFHDGSGGLRGKVEVAWLLSSLLGRGDNVVVNVGSLMWSSSRLRWSRWSHRGGVVEVAWSRWV